MKIKFEFNSKHYNSLGEPIIIYSVNVQTALIKLALEIDLSDVNTIYIDKVEEEEFYEEK